MFQIIRRGFLIFLHFFLAKTMTAFVKIIFYIFIYIKIYVYICVCVCVCACVCVCVCVCIDTHTLPPDLLIMWSENRSFMSNSLRSHGLCSPWNSPGQNTGVGSLSLLQEIFWTQRPNPGLPHCRRIICWLSHKESPPLIIQYKNTTSLGSGVSQV